MERKFLETLVIDKKGGLLDKETVEKIIVEHGKSTEKQKADNEALTTERDSLKTQLEEISKKLGEFDGVDPAALKKEIEDLRSEMTTKEAEFTTQLADRDFQALVNSSISAEKGLNPKAITALLEIDKLKTSKNQKEDVAAALKTLRESDAYLFGKLDESNSSGTDTPAQVSTGGKHNEEGKNNTASSGDTNAFMNAQIRGALKGDQ